MGRVDSTNINDVMTYQKPREDQIPAFDAVREATIALGKVILANVPDCADRSTALRKLREVRMDANAAIALDGMV